jgi:hypothetical protein
MSLKQNNKKRLSLINSIKIDNIDEILINITLGELKDLLQYTETKKWYIDILNNSCKKYLLTVIFANTDFDKLNIDETKRNIELNDETKCSIETINTGECRIETINTGECRIETINTGECRIETINTGECNIELNDENKCNIELNDENKCNIELPETRCNIELIYENNSNVENMNKQFIDEFDFLLKPNQLFIEKINDKKNELQETLKQEIIIQEIIIQEQEKLKQEIIIQEQENLKQEQEEIIQENLKQEQEEIIQENLKQEQEYIVYENGNDAFLSNLFGYKNVNNLLKQIQDDKKNKILSPHYYPPFNTIILSNKTIQ